MFRSPVLAAAVLAFGTSQAFAIALPVEEYQYLPPEETTTYVERSLNHQAPLIIEHPPVAQNPYGRRRGSAAAIAGFCQEGGFVRRRDTSSGQFVIVRQREICDNVAPRTMRPGAVDPRPVWPAQDAVRTRVLRTKG
ncbi:hypothetical protein [Methylobacterium organophilum]|uniref:Uncharacterized protein n=1 Tax=Methylobacterium organophilum TaxID=410 RepID=A0ABQ4T7Q9_METOR|nr:hypothetical protein [Methylobacterium organophilum]GJE27705.1 hypothetical protein LKMONMHP_2566 [Methylobacterium organophilum]